MKPRTLLWSISLTILASLACKLTAYWAAVPEVQFVFPNENQHEFFANEPIEITFYAQGETEINYVQATLKNPNGQLLGSYGDPEGKGQNTLRASISWTPTATGRYIIYLTAYDTVGRPSEPVHLAVQVYARPVVVAQGSKTLAYRDSFDFVSGAVGEFDGGDLYLFRNGPADFSFVANYRPQVGGKQLDVQYAANDIQSVLFDMNVIREISAPDRDANIEYGEIPVQEGGLYLYKRHAPPGNYILFRVASVTDDEVTLDYVVFSLP